jgi:hypothetical protein
MKKIQKKIAKAKAKIKKVRKEIREANVAIQKAKKEIREAEKSIFSAQEEVFDVAEISKGKKKIGLTHAVRDLEKAVHLAAESSESTEEAEFKVKGFKKKGKAKKRKK